MSSSEARNAFINFFEQKGHKFWRSSPLVPYNDPTLLFVNAGMCQYKPIFLGDADKNTEFGQMKRACNTQKCIRAGGKHNDLEDVGKDVYHHTFFEMLGNWSFGDYFKELAIKMAWECLTEVYGLDPARLYATYFGGDQAAGLQPDTEARDLWLQFLPESHVLPGNMKDNFWEMGDTGPCGPCSELHYDRIGGREVPEQVNQDDPDVIEIWNLVFMQYNREASGKLSPLPHPCVDTGMGLERLVSILNDVPSNYDTDLFTTIFREIEAVCPNRPRSYEGKVGSEDPDRIDLAYRAIADHIRALGTAIADGAVPSNEGRGYVLRRILRRAVRYGRQVLNAPQNECWFSSLVGSVIKTLGEAFPELVEQREKITQIISSEELQFNKTLDRGTALFHKAIRKLKEGDELSGDVAFELFATYGFPLDLTQVMCEEKGLKLDIAGFEAAMEKHHSASDGGNAKKLIQHLTPEQIHLLKTEYEVQPTDDSLKYVWDSEKGEGESYNVTVKALFNGKDFLNTVTSDQAPENLYVIFDRTSFYAESGGQVGDTGYAQSTTDTDNVDLVITDAKKVGGYVLHVARLNGGRLSTGQSLSLTCDYARRGRTAKNHTGTHVLNCCLREVLGSECNQAGSIVDPQRLRFDFSAQKALTVAEIVKVEELMQDFISRELEVHVNEVPLESAQAIPGVRCMFGENYPNPVRVVSVGASIENLLSGKQTAEHLPVEFCGGTHLSNTRAIGKFVITSEESIARGIRRLVAVTGDTAEMVQSESTTLKAKVDELIERGAASATKTEISNLKEEINAKKEKLGLVVRKACVDSLDKLTQEKAKISKELAKERKAVATIKGKEAAMIVDQGGYKWSVVVEEALGGDIKAMEEYVNQFLSVLPETPILLLSVDPETDIPSILANVPKGNINATEWIQQAGEGMTCKAGGKPTTARGTITKGYDQDTWTRQAFDYASEHASSS